VWKNDIDVIRVRSHFSKHQRTIWEAGMQAFVDGKWEVAKANFEDVLKQSGNTDGPSQLMLSRMKKESWTCPENWPGYWR
jgi:hypothetical protein